MVLITSPIHGTPYAGGNPPGTLQVGADRKQKLVKINWLAASAPTATDDSDAGYQVGSAWWTTSGKLYYCDDDTVGAAVWTLVNFVDGRVGATGGSVPITNIIGLTQAEYDAIGTKDPNTLYLII